MRARTLSIFTGATAAALEAAHAYSPSDEHDACGVGFIAAIDGKPRREVVSPVPSTR